MFDYFPLVQPFIYRFNPEKAHRIALFALKHNLLPKQPDIADPMLASRHWNLDFKNPVGLSAGFDKNAEAIRGLVHQGFGFIETGTSTPRPQEGNPQPRLFRLTEDQAIINRLGMPNKGADNYVNNIKEFQSNRGIYPQVVMGANIGKNKDTEDDKADYLTMLRAVYTSCDYITLNISSPNTPGLRQLQKKDMLSGLVNAVTTTRRELATAHGKHVPVLVKIAPDLTEDEQQDIAEIILSSGIDGLIVGNTTISQRSRLKSAHAQETGGLSGKPLFALSTLVLANMYKLTRGSMPIVGLGGISSAEDAYAKIRAGASLVQVYTSLIYQGFGLVTQINRQLPQLLKRDGFNHLKDAIGVDAKN